MSIKEQQISHWLNRCKLNINNFKSNCDNMNNEEKSEFIRRQYALVNIINNVLSGRTKLVGIDTNKFKDKNV